MRSASSRAIASPRPAPCGLLVGGEERLEDVRHVLALDPEAVVGDLKPNVPVAARRRNANPGPGRRVAQRVVEQDPQHLGHALGVAVELDRLRPQIERHVGLVPRRRPA